MSRLDELNSISHDCEEWRRILHNRARQKPVIRFWENPDDGTAGLRYIGRVHYDDSLRADFPFALNEPAQGVLELRTDHFISKKVRDIVTDDSKCKNVVITVDLHGGEMRWSGILKHHGVKVDEEGLRFMELVFMDDLQFLQFLLGPPNPALPIPVFQFPRVFPLAGPAKWAISTMILMNLIRVEGHVWTLPDDPFKVGGPSGWNSTVQWDDWQVHIKSPDFLLDDSTLWVLLATRMNPMDAVISDSLEDAQLTLRYRRVFSDLGEESDGVMFVDQVANGALVFELVDDSGYHSPLGTFLSGTIVDGMFRSAATYVGGFVEDTLQFVDDDMSLYPDEYWGPGFLGSLASTPWLVIRDNSWTMIETSELTWSPATAVSVIVGGSNPAADALARLIIETTGSLIGYVLLGGFSGLGSIIADLVMPFLEGTIAAWLEWKNTGRAQALGWVHLWELFQTGGDTNAWSLSALAALRGGFLSSRSETSHTMTLKGTRWILPGLHFQVGTRIGSTVKEYPNHIFVNQVSRLGVKWDHRNNEAMDFEVTVGKNKAAMSLGERQARAMNKALTTMNAIGVRLVS